MHIIEITVGKTNAQFEIEEVQSGDDLNFVAVGGGETKHPIIEHEEGWDWASVFFGNDTGADDLVPGTTYTLQNGSGDTYEFTTTSDPSRVATQSQWEDLANRVKQAHEVFFIPDYTDVDFDGLKYAIDRNYVILIRPGGPLDYRTVVAQEYDSESSYGAGDDKCILWVVAPEASYLDDENSKAIFGKYIFTREGYDYEEEFIENGGFVSGLLGEPYVLGLGDRDTSTRVDTEFFPTYNNYYRPIELSDVIEVEWSHPRGTSERFQLPSIDAVDNMISLAHKRASNAPTSSSKGELGQLWTDTTNMHTYQCTAINGNNYTWTQRW